MFLKDQEDFLKRSIADTGAVARSAKETSKDNDMPEEDIEGFIAFAQKGLKFSLAYIQGTMLAFEVKR